MGAGASSSILGLEGEEGGGEVGLGELPEGCVAGVLIHLGPVEICRAAELSRAFRGAASADFVWEAKLPKNYRYLMNLAGAAASDEEGFVGDGSVIGGEDERKKIYKKEIYAMLSRPNPFDGGTKEFWLEKSSGQVCISISSKALLITGVDDRRYWNYIQSDESRFHTVAYLQQTWWFEVNGEIDLRFPVGTYSLFFRLHLGRASKRLGRRICQVEHIHGWDIKPVQFQLSTSEGQRVTSQCHLEEPGTWILYHVGDFVVQNSDALTRLKFSMTQIDCTHTKGGVCVDGVYVYPKGFGKEKFVWSNS